MQKKKNNHPSSQGERGDNWFVNEYGIIYVCATIDGKHIKRSTKKKATSTNIKFIKHGNNAYDKFLELTSTAKTIKTDFSTFGLEAIKAGAKTKRADGSWSRAGRGVDKQKQAEQSFIKHLVPYFGNHELAEINAFLVEDWQTQKTKEGYSSESISFWKSLLSQIMDRGVKYELLSTNKVRLADKIEIVNEKREGFTIEEARLMMQYSTGFIRPWLFLSFNSALRVGEMKGVQVGDFDFEFNCLYLQRAINGSNIISDTSRKNHNRIVYFSDATKKVLLNWIEEANITHWLFPSTSGSFYRTSQTIDKWQLQPLLKRLGITGTLGMTRKTFASVSDSYAMEESEMQKVMGHKEGSSVTREHYIFSHMTKAKAEKAQEKIAPINNVLFDEKIKKA